MAIGRVNTGGGIGKLYAVISVTYPEGSVCTCSNGTKTLKARDTSGKALFNVSTGTWTVTATDGSRTTSKTVSITAEGQVNSITLIYVFDVISAIASFTEVRESGTGGITVSDDGTVTVTTTGIDGGYQGIAAYYSNNLFDLRKYNTLKFKINLSGTGACTVGFYSSKTSPYFWKNVIASKGFEWDNVSGEYSVDLSSVTTKAYFGIGVSGYDAALGAGEKTAVLRDVHLYE